MSAVVKYEKRLLTVRSCHIVLFFLGICLLASACQLPQVSNASEGSLTILINKVMSKTLVPPIDMEIASYEITGLGPGGNNFSQSTSSASVTVGDLVFGQWNVTVSGKNAAGTVVGKGSGSVSVETGRQSSLSVTVAPLSGNGTIILSVLWTASNIQFPSIEAELQSYSASQIPLDFTLATGSAICQNATIPSGYYTLSIQLLDNGVLAMGAVEVVRIVSGQTTTGTFDFSQADKGTGGITVGITPAMNDPIAVTLTGQLATLPMGSSMTVTAAVPASVGNVTYIWYLNGEAKGTGSNKNPSFAVGAALPLGAYRLDVTAFATDGSRAGAATCGFTVQASTSSRTYTTTFPVAENPISENGNWTNGGDVGLDWHNVVTSPGLATGTNSPAAYSDPTALLTGNWAANQTVEATVYSVNQNESYYQEVELRLRSHISAHSITGYEINFRCLKNANAYMQVVRWNGALGDFAYIGSKSGAQYGVTAGDVVKASITGNDIKVFINNVLVGSFTDSTYATGNPGIGFDYGCGSTYGDFGFSRVAAYDASS